MLNLNNVGQKSNIEEHLNLVAMQNHWSVFNSAQRTVVSANRLLCLKWMNNKPSGQGSSVFWLFMYKNYLK